MKENEGEFHSSQIASVELETKWDRYQLPKETLILSNEKYFCRGRPFTSAIKIPFSILCWPIFERNLVLRERVFFLSEAQFKRSHVQSRVNSQENLSLLSSAKRTSADEGGHSLTSRTICRAFLPRTSL